MSAKDNIFATPTTITDFTFNSQVAGVFDDMINRSVPGYKQIIEMIGKFAAIYAKDNSNIFDLGCSLGAASIAMRRSVTKECNLFCIDNSNAMLERCKQNVSAYKSHLNTHYICDDILDYPIDNASVVVLNFTLQFVPIAKRDAIIAKIYNGLNKDGILILSEKIKFNCPQSQELINNMHTDFKRENGYSELEISQKRNAIENILKPDLLQTHEKRCIDAGFTSFTTWFQHFNFASMIAIK